MSNQSDDLGEILKKAAKNIKDNVIPKFVEDNRDTIDTIATVATNIGENLKQKLKENVTSENIDAFKSKTMEALDKNKDGLKDVFDKLNNKNDE